MFHQNGGCQLYADYVKLYSVITDPNDRDVVLDRLHLIQNWSSSWQLDMSYKKCNIMYCGERFLPDMPSVTLNSDDSILTVVYSAKDLGVTIDSDLKFDCHIAATVARANQLDN